MTDEKLWEIVNRELRTLPNVLYASRFRPGFTSQGFMASNEFDWYNSPIDLRKADIFVGFGNNSVWDLAVRRNAEYMVIGDWNEHVVMDQEYFFKPLILASENPADFLSMLSAVPLPPETRRGSLDDIFDHIERQLDTYSTEDFVNQDRQSLVDSTIEKVEVLSLGKNHPRYLRQKFERTISPFRGTEQEMYADNHSRDPKNPVKYFRDRYQPRRLLEKGKGQADTHDPMFSFLSSQEAFDRLKRLFDGNAYFVIVSFDNPCAYRAIANLTKKLGAKVSGLAVSNTVDYAAKDENRKVDILGRACVSAIGVLPIDETFTVYITRGVEPPHNYEQISMTSLDDVAEGLNSHGYDTSKINTETDYDRALRTIPPYKPTITELNTYRTRLFFGNLHFYVCGSNGNFVSHVTYPQKDKRGDELLITTVDERESVYCSLLSVMKTVAASNPGVRDYLKTHHPEGIPENPTVTLSNPT